MFKTQAPVYLIMDALDECPTTSEKSDIPRAREKVLMFVRQLTTSEYLNLRICVTSRPEPDLRVVLEPLSSRSISSPCTTRVVQKSTHYLSNLRLEGREAFLNSISSSLRSVHRRIVLDSEGTLEPLRAHCHADLRYYYQFQSPLQTIEKIYQIFRHKKRHTCWNATHILLMKVVQWIRFLYTLRS